jgi:hypothetical protein
MRGLLSTLLILTIATASTLALQIPDKKIEITIGDHASAWYQNPMWVAICILAVAVVLLLFFVARGRARQ